MLREAYRFETRNGREALALCRESESVFGALFEGKGCVEAPDMGRAAVAFFLLTKGEGVLRKYRRGGCMAALLEDRFLRNRMRQEFDVHVDYFQAGGAVPEALGVCWSRRGGWYRGAIATRRLEGTTLLNRLEQIGDTEAISVLHRTGEIIRQMHDYGIWHADLQVKNIFVGEAGVWLLDFDGARKKTSLGNNGRCRNLLRLRRSFEKYGIAQDYFNALLKGYGTIAFPPWLDWAYTLRGVLGAVQAREKS